MARSLPSGYLTALVQRSVYPLLSYELITNEDSPVTLYYGDQEYTWNGQLRTRLAIKWGKIVEEIDPTKIHELSLTFSNINNTLRSYIEPDDRLTDGKLIVRLLLKNAAGDWVDSPTSSYILFKGVMEPPERISEREFTITAVWADQMMTQQTPARRFIPTCPWRFRDGINCNYVGVETVCNRLMQSADGCDGRARRHEFGGFRSDQAPFFNLFDPKPDIRFFDGPIELKPGVILPFLNRRAVFSAEVNDAITDESQYIPLVYGRRIWKGVQITRGQASLGASQSTTPGQKPADYRNVRVLALSEGEISQINFWLAEDQTGSRKYHIDGNLWVGYWYRKGLIGAAGSPVDRDSGAHITGAQIVRPQNQDQVAFGIGADPNFYLTYSRVAYVTFVWPTEEQDENVQGDWQIGDEVVFDMDGILLNAYRGNNPSDNVVIGTTNYNTGPWQCIDLLLHAHYGLGRVVDAANDIDYQAANAAAVYTDALLTSDTANTVTTFDVTDETRLPVFSSQGFFPGQVVDVGGDARTVVKVPGIKNVDVNTPVTKPAGTTVVATIERFTSNLILDRPQPTTQVIANILTSCRGYRTYDNGRIQYKIEQPQVSDQGHFQETGYAEGYGIVAESFEWAYEQDSDVNRVIVQYSKNDGTTAMLKWEVTDWDHFNRHQEKVRTLTLPGIVHLDQADRIAQFNLALHRTVGRGANFIVGPIGMKLQPGDKIVVTHSMPDWTSKECVVTRTELYGLGDDKEFLVRVFVRPYVAAIYSDSATPSDSLIDEPAPTFKLAVVAFDQQNFRITLRWWFEDVGSDTIMVSRWSLFKSDGTFGTPPTANGEDRLRVFRPHTTEFEYQFTEQDLDNQQSLFFIVKAGTPTGKSPFSNEVEVDPFHYIAGDNANLLHGGDMNDSADWNETQPASQTVYAPDQSTPNTPEDDDGFTSPGNMIGANSVVTTNWAVGNFTKATQFSEGEIVSYTAGTNRHGVMELRARVEFSQAARQGHWEWYFDVGGAGYNLLNKAQNDTWFTYRSAVRTVDLSQLSMKVRAVPEVSTFREAGSGFGQFAGVHFVEYTAPYAVVRGDKAALKSDNTANWVELHRPFPGFAPPRELAVVLRAGEPYVLRLALKTLEGADINADFEVALWDVNSNTYWTVLAIDGVNNDFDVITANEEHFGTLFVPQTDVTGPLLFLIRTKSTNAVQVDQVGFYNAAFIPEFITSLSERSAGFTANRLADRAVSFGRRVPPMGPYEFIKVGVKT